MIAGWRFWGFWWAKVSKSEESYSHHGEQSTEATVREFGSGTTYQVL